MDDPSCVFNWREAWAILVTKMFNWKRKFEISCDPFSHQRKWPQRWLLLEISLTGSGARIEGRWRIQVVRREHNIFYPSKLKQLLLFLIAQFWLKENHYLTNSFNVRLFLTTPLLLWLDLNSWVLHERSFYLWVLKLFTYDQLQSRRLLHWLAVLSFGFSK